MCLCVSELAELAQLLTAQHDNAKQFAVRMLADVVGHMYCFALAALCCFVRMVCCCYLASVFDGAQGPLLAWAMKGCPNAVFLHQGPSQGPVSALVSSSTCFAATRCLLQHSNVLADEVYVCVVSVLRRSQHLDNRSYICV